MGLGNMEQGCLIWLCAHLQTGNRRANGWQLRRSDSAVSLCGYAASRPKLAFMQPTQNSLQWYSQKTSGNFGKDGDTFLSVPPPVPLHIKLLKPEATPKLNSIKTGIWCWFRHFRVSCRLRHCSVSVWGWLKLYEIFRRPGALSSSNLYCSYTGYLQWPVLRWLNPLLTV